MKDLIELKLPKFGVVTSEDQSLTARLGPPGWDMWPILPWDAFSFGIMWTLFNSSLEILAVWLAIHGYVHALYSFTYKKSVGSQIEINPDHIAVTIDGTPEPAIPINAVKAIQPDGKDPVTNCIDILGEDGKHLANLPIGLLGTSSGWLTMLAVPPETPVRPPKLPSRETKQRIICTFLFFCVAAIPVVAKIWPPSFVKFSSTAHPDGLRLFIPFSFSVWLMCLPVVMILILNKVAMGQVDLRPSRRVADFLPVSRALVRAKLGFPPESTGQTYVTVLPGPFLDGSTVLLTLRTEIAILTLPLGGSVAWFLYQEVFLATPTNPASPVAILVGVCAAVLLPILVAAYREALIRTKQGTDALHTRLILSDPPIFNGQPVEKMSLSLNPTRLFEVKHRPTFPDTITAGGKTYRVNYLYFKPVPEDEEREG